MGGIVIYCVSVFLLFSFYNDLNSIRLIGVGSLIILLCGIIDDIRGLKYSTKFLFQISASLSIIIHYKEYLNNVMIFGFSLPFPLDLIILLIFYVGVINAINWMDGLDGLITGYSLIMFSVIFVLSYQRDDAFLIMLSAAFIGSLLGFTKFNAYPANIFLGDTGSMILGYFLLVSLTEISLSKTTRVLDLTLPIYFLALPIVDTLKVIIIRLLRGSSIFHSDFNHLHHIMLSYKIRHKTTVFFIQIITISFCVVALYYYKTSSLLTIVPFTILSLLIIFIDPILKVLYRVELIRKKIRVYEELPAKLISVLRKFIYKASFLLLFILGLLSFPLHIEINSSYLLILLIAELVLLSLALFQKSYKEPFIHWNVFFNFTIYFWLYNIIKYNDQSNLLLLSYLSNAYFIYCFAGFTLILLLFLTARHKIIPADYLFLRGTDLTIIVFILITFILRVFIGGPLIIIFSSSMLMAFIFYLWYKVYIVITPSRGRYLFYGSFALPSLALISMLF